MKVLGLFASGSKPLHPFPSIMALSALVAWHSPAWADTVPGPRTAASPSAARATPGGGRVRTEAPGYDPDADHPVAVGPVEQGGDPGPRGGALGSGRESSLGVGFQFKFGKSRLAKPDPAPSPEPGSEAEAQPSRSP